jgi:hypothetical protein
MVFRDERRFCDQKTLRSITIPLTSILFSSLSIFLPSEFRLDHPVLAQPASSQDFRSSLIKPNYQAVLPVLKQRTQILLLLPPALPSELSIYGSIDTATATGYRITLDYSPSCQGAAACTLGRMIGHRSTPHDRPLTGQKVSLRDGKITAYFSPVSPENCNVGYCFSSLTWDWQGSRYQLLLKSSQSSIFQHVANSTLQQGALRSQSNPTLLLAANPQSPTAEDVRQIKQALPDRSWILDQAFRVTLQGLGTGLFVPVKEERKLRLYLVQNRQRSYSFPLFQYVERQSAWNFLQVNAVAFRDLSFDGRADDIILIADYWAGPSGPGTSPPFSVVQILLNQGGKYSLEERASRQLTNRGINSIAAAEKILANELLFTP